MLNDNHLWLFILAFLPALVYSFIIYFNDRNNIKFSTALSYIIGGCISITFLNIFTTVFPKFQEMLFTVSNGVLDLTTLTLRQKPSSMSWLMFAFIQVALLEETAKAMAWKTMSLFRKGDRGKRDTLFSTMFYSCMISVGFAGIENLEYFINYHNIFIERSLTAVLTHMICGIFMGYFIALSRVKKDAMKRIGYQLMGVLAATAFHGAYDWLVMAMGDQKFPINFPFTHMPIQPFHIAIFIGLILATICGRNLLNYSLRYGRIQRTRLPSPPAR